MPFSPYSLRAAALVALTLAVSPVRAEPPELKLHQAYIENLQNISPLDLKDPLAVFAFVFAKLPERVKVYPTENYFYFTFIHDGTHYAGNIRIDASDRDQGYLSFAYYEDYALWRPGDQDPNYRRLSSADGVKLEKVTDFSYKATFSGKTVIFDLNDLRGVKPPAGMMNSDEDYLGPVFDESGVQFYLLFNKTLKVFHYVLNETAFPDKLDKSKVSDRVEIGRRTGFAFYRDRQKERKILIGAHETNSFVNNYFDGPFDQLPDNFQEGDALRKAILQIVPDMEGKLDRWGSLPDGSERFAITPYLYFGSEDDLKIVDQCIDDKTRPADAYYLCFDLESLAADLPEKQGEATTTPGGAVPAKPAQ